MVAQDAPVPLFLHEKNFTMKVAMGNLLLNTFNVHVGAVVSTHRSPHTRTFAFFGGMIFWVNPKKSTKVKLWITPNPL